MRRVVSPMLCVLAAYMVAVPSDAVADTLRVGRDAPTLQATLDLAGEGDIVQVSPGKWPGPATIHKRITLRGIGAGAIVDGGGVGTVLTVEAPGTVVENITVRRSGSDLAGMKPDTCVWVSAAATGAIIRDNLIEDCAFGIWVDKTAKAQILDNRILGRKEQRPTDRGNGIQLFDASFLLVRGNDVSGARDGIYVSAVEDSVIEGNHTYAERYGVHYMYSQRNTLRNNVSSDNINGFALMESRELTVVGNLALRNERHGILFRDATDCLISGNEARENGEGLFFFSSADNTIVNNRLIRNDVGAKIWAGSQRNTIVGNVFIANRQQVFYVGAKDLVLGTDGRGNYWSDYVGWDQDNDGIGDRAYRMASFTSHLVYKYPAAAMLMNSPGIELLSLLEDRMPLLTMPTVVDLAPLVQAPPTRAQRAQADGA